MIYCLKFVLEMDMFTNIKNKYVGDRAFYKKVMLVAVPIMIQNGITNFVNLLDNIMVGRLGNVEMTGVAIVNQLMFVFNLTIFGIISGAGIFTAQFFGKGDIKGTRATFRYKLITASFISLTGILLMHFFSDELIRFYLMGEGNAEDIEGSFRFAKQYLNIALIGIVPFALSQCYSGTLRETGETIVPMKAGIISVCVNFIFNVLLIFGYLGFPRLGVAGAAVATVISRIAELLFVSYKTHKAKDRHEFIKGAYKSFKIPYKLSFEITKKAIPLMLNEALWAGGMAVLVQCYSVRGYDVVSALNINSTIGNVFNVSFIAMGSAIGIIIGQMLGSGAKDEAVSSVNKLIAFSLVLCTAVGVVMGAVAPFFPLIYKTTGEIRSLASQLIICSALCMPIHSLANACYFTLRSGGKTLITVLFDSCFVWIISVPFAFLLSRYTGIPVVPLYFMCTAIDVVKCIIGVIMLKKGIWINNIVEEHKMV